MRCLTVQQPFAQLIVCGLKRLETRPWPTDYRGLLIIHAARHTEAPESMVDFANKLLRANGHDPPKLVRGAAIGAAFIAACYSARQWREHLPVASLINSDEEQLGFFNRSYFAFNLIEPVEFARPIPCRGQLHLWEPGSDLRKRIAAAISAGL
jgi:hypothetical protein